MESFAPTDIIALREESHSFASPSIYVVDTE